ncbi:hypothetical protein J6590_013011 [Homalodisca vitripennis]|nr:hypothetical protein J6590_013011 [Homalodisca vitripennis]
MGSCHLLGDYSSLSSHDTSFQAAAGRRSRTHDAVTTITRQVTHYHYLVGAMAYYTIKTLHVRRDQCEQSSSRETQDDAATTITRQVTHYPYLVGAMAYYTIKHCKETSANRAAAGRRSRTDAATTITRQVTHYHYLVTHYQYLVGAMAYYTIKHCSTSQQWAVSVRGDQCEQSSSRETQDDAATTITRQVTHYQYLVGAMAYYTIKHCSTSQQWAVSVRGDQCEQSSSRETQDDAATTITRQVTHYHYLVGAMAYYTIKHCSTSQHWAVSVRGDQCEQSSSRETQDDAATTITRQVTHYHRVGGMA